MFLPEGVTIALGVAVLVVLGLGYASRRHPHVKWMRAFDLQRNLTEAQRARIRRSVNVTAGVELILLGVVIPLGYFALTLMFFSSPEPIDLVVVGVLSGLCVVLGTLGLVRSR